jgi:hypothetical protein
LVGWRDSNRYDRLEKPIARLFAFIPVK